MKPDTIVIINENAEELRSLIDVLEGAGFRVVFLHNSAAVKAQIADVAPDLILLDVLMPEMDGFTLCQSLKDDLVTSAIPVIFLTALAEPMEKLKGFEAGGVDYIIKPVQPQEVLARIRTHLTIRTLQQQLQRQNSLLEEQNERFRTFSEATFEGILIHERGEILEINPALEKMFGYQRAEMLGRNLLEFIPAESRRIVLHHLHTQDDMLYEARAVRRDGSSFPLELQSRSIPYQGRTVRVVALRDLSWHKQIEAEKAHLQWENITLRSAIGERSQFGELIGKSPAMQTVYRLIINAAASDANVVLCGESGTGKELVARTIHHLSERQEKKFVAVNCGAIPETLFEREFFGHRKGAFTGANMDTPGYLAQADRGTLFLDEIGELRPLLQVKLLRALQEHEYTPLGDTISRKVDIRIIAATIKELKLLVQEGIIREDFFWRIRVIVINLPPLRQRKEDIPLLIEHFLRRYDKGDVWPTIPPHLMKALCAYDWPGNVRELQNEIQRYLAAQQFEFIGNPRKTTQVSRKLHEEDNASAELRDLLNDFEKEYILHTLTRNHGHRGRTAKTLHISRRTLNRKMQKYRIS